MYFGRKDHNIFTLISNIFLRGIKLSSTYFSYGCQRETANKRGGRRGRKNRYCRGQYIMGVNINYPINTRLLV